VQRVSAKYLIESNRTTGTFLPAAQTPLRADVAAPTDPSIALQGYKGGDAIAQGETFNSSASNVAKHTKYLEVRKGIKLALIEKKERGGLVVADLVFHFGNPTNLANTSTLGEVVAVMLQRGTEKKTRQQIQDTLDALKAVIRVSYEPGGLAVSVLSTHENLAATLALVAEILRQPSFPASELALLKQQAITQSEARRHNPDAIAREIAERTSNPYPPESPRYVPTIDQRIAAIQAITPEDVRRFYRLANASNADISIVGEFDSAAIAQTINSLFGDWQSSSPFVRIPTTYFSIPGGRKIVEVADKANATYVGRINLSMREDDPDYPALLMATQMMGGGALHSRLADRIRQKDGLSYSVSMRLSAELIDHVGSLSFYAIFAPQNLGRLETDIQEEFASAEATGFKAEELDAARTGWLRSRSLARSQDSYLSGTLSEYSFAGLTFENEVRLEQAVSKVTPDDAARALKKYASPGNFLFVGAGTFDKQPSSASLTPAK
jgi:zinc protease